jgi:hypothetical protein
VKFLRIIISLLRFDGQPENAEVDFMELRSMVHVCLRITGYITGLTQIY